MSNYDKNKILWDQIKLVRELSEVYLLHDTSSNGILSDYVRLDFKKSINEATTQLNNLLKK